MKGYNKEEFFEYVKTLEFDELEDCAAFIQYYYDYYRKLPEEPKEEKDLAWHKYLILMSKFGITFVSFTASVIEFRKKLQNEIDQEKNGNTGPLEA